VTKVKVSLRSIFFKFKWSFDPEALDGQNSLTLVTLAHVSHFSSLTCSC